MTTTDGLRVVPASEAPWQDLQAVFGDRGDPSKCQCQRFKLGRWEWTPTPVAERAATMRDETGEPGAGTTTGLVAYLDDVPVGWCAVEPRVAYPRLLDSRSPVVWKGRNEDRSDEGVWSVTCFVTRAGHRRRGVSAALAAAAVGFARDRGARAVEGYPMLAPPGKDITWGELFVGSATAFADAGYVEVSHPTPRRVVMRIDF